MKLIINLVPPKAAPVDQIGETLGLCKGLRVDRADRPFRCHSCLTMEIRSTIVWVPDGLRIGDSQEVVVEICRQSAYNGCYSGWCLKCAQRLSGKSWVKTTVTPTAASLAAKVKKFFAG